MKKSLCKMFVAAALLLLPVLQVFAQTRAVSGTVYDSDGKSSLPGASVILKGTTTGVTANIDGKYTITAGPDAVLEFRSLGYETQEIPVGDRTVIDVTMKESSIEMDAVVVTALGMTRKQKALGYAVSTMDNEELTATSSSNWMNAMNGKIAGLTFEHAGSGPGGTMRVTLRGNNSLNHGANEALFVVDGVPINSSTVSSSSVSNYAQVDSPVDFGSGSSELNPEDIESVSVLKGPSATALYGSRAANGAIIITTKSGRKDKGYGVSLNSSVVFERAGFWPDFQTEYGSGSDMGIEPFNFWIFDETNSPDGIAHGSNYSRYAFGERFNPGVLRYQYNSKNWDNNTYAPTPWVYQDDWYTGLFRTGVTWNNSVAVEGNNGEGTSSRFSFSDTRNEWILPNTGYNQQTVSATINTVMNKYISLRTKLTYLHKQSDNLPNQGYGESSALYDLTWGFNSNSINEWRDEYFQGRFNYVNWESSRRPVALGGHSLVYPSQEGYNPYRTLYEELNAMNRNRVYGNATLVLNLFEGLTLDLRAGIDFSDEFRNQRKPFYTTGRVNGFYREQNYQNFDLNTDFLFQYANNKLFDERLGINATFGGIRSSYHYRQEQTTLSDLNEEGVYHTENPRTGTHSVAYNYRRQKQVQSLLGLLSLSWDDTYFLDITGRNDWSSTLAPKNWSFFYPSVSASAVLSQALDFGTVLPQVTFLKLRLSWANVGNDTDAYNLDRYYSLTAYPSGYRLPGTIPDPLIRPENVENWEAGLEAKFLQNRIGIDAAVYQKRTTDQIVPVDNDWITGAASRMINAGEIRNRGVELQLNLVPVKSRNFEWSMDFNWYKIWNTLVSLQPGWDPATPYQTNPGTTIGGRTYIYSFIGEEMDYIYGKGFQKAPEGSFYLDGNGNRVDCSGMDLVNPANGYPELDPSPNRRIGKVNPDWRAGMGHRFTYKNLTLSAFFTAQWGGNTFSVTNFSLSYIGKLKNSLPGRYDGLVHPGVNEVVNADGTVTYTPNTAVTNDITEYYSARYYVRDNTEKNTFDTSFLKFKELRLDYRFPASLLGKTGFLQNASLGVYATNLFCLTDFPHYDPEAGMMSGNQIYKGIEAMTFPMTRTYGVNLRVSF